MSTEKTKLKEPICIWEDGSWCFFEDYNASKYSGPCTITYYVDLSKFTDMDKRTLSVYKE